VCASIATLYVYTHAQQTHTQKPQENMRVLTENMHNR